MTRPLSITLITSGLGAGGSEAQLCQLAIGLRHRAWAVNVVSLQKGGAYRSWLLDAGIAVDDVPIGRLAHPARLRQLHKLIGKDAPDLVHTQAFRANLWARAVAIGLNRPVVASLRATYTYYPSWYYPVERRLAARTARVVVPSTDAARHLTRHLGIPAAKVVVIPNGVDLDSYASARGRGSAFRDRWGLAGMFVVLAPGRLIAHKGHALVIRAFEGLIRHWPASVLVVAGTGPLAEELRGSASRILDKIRFVGELTRDDMVAAMGAADVVCLMSRSEGMPNVVLEAMAAGVPVIASNVDGTREVVKDGVTGRLVAHGDTTALSRLLIDLAGSPATRDELGRNGRLVAEHSHSVDLNVERHEHVYHSVLRSGSMWKGRQ